MRQRASHTQKILTRAYFLYLFIIFACVVYDCNNEKYDNLFTMTASCKV